MAESAEGLGYDSVWGGRVRQLGRGLAPGLAGRTHEAEGTFVRLGRGHYALNVKASTLTGTLTFTKLA